MEPLQLSGKVQCNRTSSCRVLRAQWPSASLTLQHPQVVLGWVSLSTEPGGLRGLGGTFPPKKHLCVQKAPSLLHSLSFKHLEDQINSCTANFYTFLDHCPQPLDTVDQERSPHKDWTTHGLKPRTRQWPACNAKACSSLWQGEGKAYSSMNTIVLSRHLVTYPGQQTKFLLNWPIVCTSALPPCGKLAARSPAETSPTRYPSTSTRTQCMDLPVQAPRHSLVESFSLHPHLNHPRLWQAPVCLHKWLVFWQARKAETSQDLVLSL